MPTRFELKQLERMGGELSDLNKEYEELEGVEKAFLEGKQKGSPIEDRGRAARQTRMKKIRQRVEELSTQMNELAASQQEEEAPGQARTEEGLVRPEGEPEKKTAAGPASAPGEKPAMADAGVTGAAGTQPGGDYDINIGIGEGGEIVAPQGLTPEQMAVMVPGAFGAATPGQVKDAAERPSMPTAPPGGRPPKDFSPTDYSPEGRRRFETQVMSQIGFNPITFNPMDHVNKSMTQLPALFNHVFDGKIMWADRNKLDKKQLSHWMNVVKQFRADRLREGNEQQEIGLRQYNYMMNRFDKEAAVKQKNLEAMRKAPKTMSFWDAEKGAMVMHEYKDGQWVPTDKITAEPKAEGKKDTADQKAKDTEYKRAWDLVRAYGASKQQDFGDAPSADSDAIAKLQEIMALMGDDKGIPEGLEKAYQEAIRVIQEYWGVTPEEVTGATGATGAKPAMKFDKTGKRIQ